MTKNKNLTKENSYGDDEETSRGCTSFLSFVPKLIYSFSSGFCTPNAFESLVDKEQLNEVESTESTAAVSYLALDEDPVLNESSDGDTLEIIERGNSKQDEIVYKYQCRNMIMFLLTICHTLCNHQSLETLRNHDFFFLISSLIFSIHACKVETSPRRGQHQQGGENDQESMAIKIEQKKNESMEQSPEISKSVYKPVYICPSRGTSCPTLSRQESLPVGTPFEIETETFKGQALIRFAHGVCDDSEKRDEYFATQKKETSQNTQRQIVVQGRFKKAFPMDKVLFGAMFDKPLNVPFSPRMIKFLQGVFDKFAPGIRLNLGEKRHSVLAPIGSGCHTMSINDVGEEPDITSSSLPEETFMSNCLKSSKKRAKILGNPKTASKHTFETDKIYTFHSIDHVIDLVDYQLLLPLGMKVDIIKPVGKQPFNFTAMTESDETIFSFDFWHEKILKEWLPPLPFVTFSSSVYS
ncbi:hypothetical protein CTEN210_06203 [Chaetoceros tenuissimus]|uniref:Domain of unknown function at the cortex 1 domain-containing protein n=1 Tax=Chaetoceros tenuissimus TaxID=426638 RepID=A0AAD3H3Y4_9STRA|nr:hypothetical protein CTEN210_06203 [Chaetoceros tenuissimus]